MINPKPDHRTETMTVFGLQAGMSGRFVRPAGPDSKFKPMHCPEFRRLYIPRQEWYGTRVQAGTRADKRARGGLDLFHGQ